jgi:hypothetical protein
MFVIVSGYASLWSGLRDPIAWVSAAPCTAMGLAAYRDPDRVGARFCLPTIADGDRTVFATSGQYAYRLPGIAGLRQAAGRGPPLAELPLAARNTKMSMAARCLVWARHRTQPNGGQFGVGRVP